MLNLFNTLTGGLLSNITDKIPGVGDVNQLTEQAKGLLPEQLSGITEGNMLENLNSLMDGELGQTVKNTLGTTGQTAMNIATHPVTGGLLGTAAIGGVVGALLKGSSSSSNASSNSLGTMAQGFLQKWANPSQATQANAQTTQGNMQNMQNEVRQGKGSGKQGKGGGKQAQGNARNPVANAPENTALLFLESMVYAAKADGHIDDTEKQNIHNAIEQLFPGNDISRVIDSFMDKPIDPNSLAAKVVSKEQGCDLYRLSCAAVNIDSFMERSYLDGLALALGLSNDEKAQLEREALSI